MWELHIQLASVSGAALPGHRVTAAFQLRLAGAGADLMMPAEAVGVSDVDGRALLSLPSPASLGDLLKFTVRDADNRVVHEVEMARAALQHELRLVVGGPATPTSLNVELTRGGQPLASVDVVVLGRAEGASSFSLVLAGRTDEAGRLSGPYPVDRYAEASAMVRVDGNQTLPVALNNGALPPRLLLSLAHHGATPAPTPATTPATTPAPKPAPPSEPVAPPSAGSEVPATLVRTLSSTTNPSIDEEDDDTSDERRARRRRSRSSVLSEALPEKLTYGILALILLIGAFLRFYDLGGQSLWNDELSSWRRASYDTIDKVIKKGAGEDVHPPGYYLILHMVQRVSDTEFALRLPSAVAGVLSLLVIYLLGRRIWSDREGLIAAALMAVVWAPIRYSQEARSYALLMLVTMLSIWAWMTMLREIERKGRVTLEQALWYVLPAAGLMYLHYFGVLMVGLQALGAGAFALRKRHRQGSLSHLAGIYVAIGLIYLPWMGNFFEDLTQSKSWMESPDEAESSTLWSYLKFLFNHQGGVAGLMALLVLGAGAWGLVQARSAGKLNFTVRTRWGLVALWAFTPYAVTWLQSVLATPVLSNRNLLISAPAIYLLVGRAITALPLRSRVQAGLAVVVVAIAGISFSSKNYYSKPNRQQYRELVQYVVDHEDEAPKAAIIVTGQPAHFNYYLDRLEASQRANISASSEDDLVKVKKLLEEENPRSIWRLRAGKNVDSPVDAFLAERFSVADEQELYGVGLTLYKRAKEGDEADPAEEEAPAEEGENKKKKGKKAEQEAAAPAEDAADTGEAPAEDKPKKKKDAEKGASKSGKKGSKKDAEAPATPDTGS